MRLIKLSKSDFNLNLTRYVDTFEEEEEIDIDAVVKEIQTIDQEMKETDKIISDFCQELNIKSPF